MEKLQTVTDIFASAGVLLSAEFLGEAESNTLFEQVFGWVRNPNGGFEREKWLITLLGINYDGLRSFSDGREFSDQVRVGLLE